MRKIARFLVLFLIFSISVFPYADQSSPGAHSIESRVDALFAQWSKVDSPGAALAVIRDGKIIYAKGYGMADLEHNVPIAPDTVFYIGSTSKQFVAMCILLLEAEGKLSLDDDIRKYLPDFPIYDRPLTIRHLIHHTSGLRDDLALWSLAGRDILDSMPEDAVYEMLCRQKALNHTPGEQYVYSNSCYFLLSMIVKKASGESLREYADRHIFRPLQMTSSHFHDDNLYIIKNRAFGYTQNNDGKFGNLHMRFALVGSGGLYTSVNDLFKWDQNFYQNRLGQKDPGLIRKMYQNGKLNNGTELTYAFALQNGAYRGLRTVSHGGALAGYRAELLRFPDQHFSVIILSNLDRFDPSRLAYKVSDIYLENLLQPQKPMTDAKVGERKEVSVDPALLDLYVGKYQIAPGAIVEIFKEENRLMTQIAGQPKFQLFPTSNTEFFLKVVDAQVTFEPEKKQIIIHQNGQTVIAKKTEATVVPIVLTPDQLIQYAGDYYSDELMVTYQITKDEKALFLKFGYNPITEMKPVSSDLFNAGFLIHFLRNDKNGIIGLDVNAGRVQSLNFVRKQ